MLLRLTRVAARHPVRIVAVTVAVAIVAMGLAGNIASRLDPYDATDPASESSVASDTLESRTHKTTTDNVVALVDAGVPLESTAARTRVLAVARELKDEPALGPVADWYSTHDPALRSHDGRSTYLVAPFRTGTDQDAATDRLLDRFERSPGVQLGGTAVTSRAAQTTVESDLRRAEAIAFPLLFLLSLWVFRGAVAALLPPLVGGVAILLTFLGLRIAAEFAGLSVFAVNLVTGLGLGLAIDYSLFIVSRYREESARHGYGFEALRRTMLTAGRTVLFSSITIALALASLLVFPQQFLYSMGIGGVLVALIAAAVALVALPAALTLLGPRVNALAPARLQRAAAADARPDAAGAWYRLSRFVMRRPGRVAVASGALLIALGIPFLGIRFTTIDSSVLPKQESARMVDQVLRRDFPPNRTMAITLVVSGSDAQADAVARRVRAMPDVASVTTARAAPGLARVDVVPRSRPLSQASQDLVHRIRATDFGVRVGVTGNAAKFADQKDSLASHLGVALPLLALSTFVVLFLFTGSLILPLKALLMDLLTLSAAFGLLVLIFQDGRLQGVLGYESQGALESSQPVLLFALVFGLATDYGVFLLSRIKEARDRGASDREAVALGLERTGRIVTAAALLFCVAIGTFATSDIVFVKELGVGTALAVLIDATIVRALLVPSLMEMLGRWNWWAPRPLRRLHTRWGLSERREAARA